MHRKVLLLLFGLAVLGCGKPKRYAFVDVPYCAPDGTSCQT